MKLNDIDTNFLEAAHLKFTSLGFVRIQLRGGF